jgi:hypothetical protein
VMEHSEDDHTFTLLFDAQIGEKTFPVGTIFKPNAEFMFRVLGIAPANITDNTLVSVGRFEAACKRTAPVEESTRARMGIDVARGGKDYGTLFIRHAGCAWRAAQFWKEDTNVYNRAIKKEALALADLGVKSLHIRMDAGGGFHSGVIDQLKKDIELREAFEELVFIEVHFGIPAPDRTKYDNLITQMHGEAAETISARESMNGSTVMVLM